MVSVRKHLDSDVIRIPEAAALVGKDVRITVEEIVESPAAGGEGKLLKALDELAEAIRTGESQYDLDAVEELRRRSR